jgi:hypothetical protein
MRNGLGKALLVAVKRSKICAFFPGVKAKRQASGSVGPFPAFALRVVSGRKGR